MKIKFGSNNLHNRNPAQRPMKLHISKAALAELKAKSSEVIAPRSSTLRSEDVTTILNALQTKFNLSEDTVKIILAIFFQQGGTSRSCDGNTEISVYGTTYKLASIRAVLKDCKFPRSEKKLARSLSDEIFEICKVLKLKGNLSAKIRRENPDHTFTEDDDIWLSDFQSNNEKAPSSLRTLIQKDFKSKRSTTNRK
jgi:hypothetical protein